jgi:hypothetical protein
MSWNIDYLHNFRNTITHPISQFNLYIVLWGVECTAFEIGHSSLYPLFLNFDTKPKLEGELFNRTVARWVPYTRCVNQNNYLYRVTGCLLIQRHTITVQLREPNSEFAGWHILRPSRHLLFVFRRLRKIVDLIRQYYFQFHCFTVHFYSLSVFVPTNAHF